MRVRDDSRGPQAEDSQVERLARFDVRNAVSGRSASSVQVIVYGMVAATLAVSVSQGAGKLFPMPESGMRTVLLTLLAILVGAIAGVLCDPILGAVNNRQHRT